MNKDHLDQLLAEQPVKASSDFAARTLARVENEPQQKKRGRLAPILRIALPIAAAWALAFLVISQLDDEPTAPTEMAGSENQPVSTDNSEDALTTYEIQELLLLQEGLSGFAQIESDELNSNELLNTLDTLYSI